MIDRKFFESHRGAAAVEAAAMLPIIMLLIFGYVEIGWHINNMQLVHDAARQGARAAVLTENTNQEVADAVAVSLMNSAGISNDAISIQIWKLDENGKRSYQVNSLDDNENGEAIEVAVTVDSEQFKPLVCLLHLAPQSLSCSVSMQRFD